MNFYYITATDNKGREVTVVLKGNVKIKSMPPSIEQEEHNLKITADTLEVADNKDTIGVWQWGGMK